MTEEKPLPFVSVVVPHYNDLGNLKICLERLRRQSWPRDRCEVIVADNNSSCGIEAVRRIALDIRVVPAMEQGAGPARNEAVAGARREGFAFIEFEAAAGAPWVAVGV